MQNKTTWFYVLTAFGSLPVTAMADNAGGARGSANSIGLVFFVAFALLTLGLTFYASRRTRTAADFLATGGISSWQNGLAIAGDFISAASFLGGTGLAYQAGYDSVFFMMGSVAGWPLLLILISDRLRNLGKYTFVDVVAYRLDGSRVRTLAAIGTLLVVLQYLVAQMVGAGRLIETLFGLPYSFALVIIGVLMMIYVIFGGMLAATWIQSTKAVLLIVGLIVLATLVLNRFDFSVGQILLQAEAAHPRGAQIFTPVNLAKDPLGSFSLGLGLMFGLLGLPHLLMRFFTVRDAATARKSVVIAAAIFIGFTMTVTLLGFAAIPLLVHNSEFLGPDGKLIGGINMVPLHLARLVGGDILYGYISAVVFATILAAVAGLMISGTSAVSHDLYTNVFRKGRANDRSIILCSRATVVALGIVSMIMAFALGSESLPMLIAMAFAVAASVNFPILILALYWRGLTTRGALLGGGAGLLSSVTLIILGPTVWVAALHHPAPIFPVGNPTLFSMLIAFAACWIGSVTDKSTRGKEERSRFDEQLYRSTTGIGAETPSGH